MTTLLRLTIAAALVAAGAPAAAQTGSTPAYPAKLIRMVVPYPPDAGTDLHARALAQKMTEALGQPVIVDNRSGANGIPAMELVRKARLTATRSFTRFPPSTRSTRPCIQDFRMIPSCWW